MVGISLFSSIRSFSNFIVNIFIGFPADGTPVIVKAFEWFTIGGIQVNFGFQIDQLSLMMMMIVTGIGSFDSLVLYWLYEP